MKRVLRFSLYGFAMPEGKQNRKAVKDVFDFFYTDLVPEDKALFYLKQIYRDYNTFEIVKIILLTLLMQICLPIQQKKKCALLENWEY